MEVEDTLLQDSSRGMSIERGESFEVEDPPRLKRSKLLSGRSGGTDNVMDAFFSGFKTSLSASAGGDVVDGENGDSSQRDSSALISKDDEEGENSARENPFDRNHGSDSRVRFLDSEEGGVVTADGGSRESWTADGGALANGSVGPGDQDTIFDDLRDGRGDEAEREAPELDGSQAGRFGSSDDRSDYLAGRNQRAVEMDFESGSAARNGDVSVQYPPQSSVGEYPAFTTPSRSPRDYSADSLDLSSTGSASADSDSVLENVLSKRASIERGESFEVAEKFTVKRSQFSKSRGTHGSGFLGDFHVSLADCLEDRAEKDASDLNATRAQSVSSETHEPDKAAGRSFEFADNEQKSSAPSFDRFGAGESRSQATELSFSDNFLDSFTSENRPDELTDEIQPSVTREQFTNDCSDPPLSQGTRSAQNIHEDTSSVSSPRRLSSAPSVERGESFEVSTPRMLRRQDRHGFVMGSGGFHTSFHSLVREEDDSATAAHRADRDDNCGDPEDPGSASWTERAISTAQDAYSSLERKLRRESGKKMQKLESYNRDNASSADDNDDIGRDGSSDEGNSSEDSESDDKDEDSASSPHSAAEEDEGEEADANAHDRAKAHVKSDSFEYVHASALMASPRMRSQSEDILEEQGTGAEDLETTPSGGLATPRSNSVTMEQVREVSHIVMNNPVISDQGDSHGDDSTNRAIERAFRTDSITTEIDTSALFPTETIAPATGSAPSKRLSSTPSIERGESFEVSAPRQLRHQTHQGFSVGAGGFHTSFHASLEEEAEEEEEEEEEEEGAPLEQNDQDVVSDETTAKSEDPNSPGWLEKAATVAKDAYSVLETKLNMKSKKKPKGDMDEREEDQDEENSGSDEDENSHAEDGELSTSLQTSPDGSKVHEEDTQFTGRTDSNDMLSMEKEQEEATTVTSADIPVSAEDHSFNQEAEQEDLLKKDTQSETFVSEVEFQVDDMEKEQEEATTVTSADVPVIAEDHSFSQEAEQDDLLKKDTQSETFVSEVEFQVDDMEKEQEEATTVTSADVPVSAEDHSFNQEAEQEDVLQKDAHGETFAEEEEQEGGVHAKTDSTATVSHEAPDSPESAEAAVSAEDHSFSQEAEQEDLLKKDAHGETIASGTEFQVDDNAELWPLDKETSAAEVTVTSPTAPLKSAPSIERGESFEVSAPKTLRDQGGRGFLVGPGGFQTSFHSTAEDYRGEAEEEEEEEGYVNAKSDAAATVSHEDPDSPESAEAAVSAEDHTFNQEAEQEDLLKKDTQSETFVSEVEFQVDDMEKEQEEATTVTSADVPVSAEDHSFNQEAEQEDVLQKDAHGDTFAEEEEQEGGVHAKTDSTATVSHEAPDSPESAEAAVIAEDHSFSQEAEQDDLLKKDAHGETIASGTEFQVDDNAELWPLDKETSAAEVTVTSPTTPLKSAPSIERGEPFEVSAPKTLRHQGGRGFLVGPGGFQTSFHSTAEDYREEEEDNVIAKTDDTAAVSHEDPNSPSWMQRVVSAAKDTYSSLEKKIRRRRKRKSPNDSGCVDHDIEGDHEDADDDTDSLDESEGETGSEEYATDDNYRHIKVEEKTDTNLQNSSDNLVTELQTTEFAEQDSWAVTSPDKFIEVKDETAINLQNSPDNRVSESQATELAEQENWAVTSPNKLIEVEEETATNLQTSPDNLVTESQRTDIAEQENWAVTSPDRLIEVEEETATNLQTSPANLVSESQTGELAEQDNMAVASPSSSPEYQALPTRRHSHDVFGATSGGDTSPKQARRSSTELKPSFERLSSVGRAYSELRKDAWLPGRQNTNPFVDSDEDSPQVNEHTESTRQDAVSSERLSVKRTNTNPFIDDIPEDAMSKGGECARPIVRENTNPFLEDIAAEANPENSSDATSLPAASFDEIFEDVKKQTDEGLESSSSKDPGSLELRRSLFRSRGQKKETLNSSTDQSSQFTSVTTSSSNNTSTGLSDSTSEQEEDKLFSPGNPFAIPEFSGDLSPVTEACESTSYRSFGYPVDDSPDTDKILRFGSDAEDASRTRTDADSFGDDNVTAETEASFPPARLTESDRNSSITSSNFSQSVSMEAFENSFVSSTAHPSAELPTGQSLHDELATATRHSEPFSSQYEPGFHLTTSGTSLQVSDQGDLLGEEERANNDDEPFEVDIESHINVEMEPEQPLAHDPAGRKSRSLSLPLGDGMHRKMNATTWDRAYLTRYRSFGDSGLNPSARGRLSSTRSFDSYMSSPWSPTRDPDLGKSSIARSLDGSDDQDLLAGTNKTVFAAQDTSAEKPLRGRKAKKDRAGGQEHPVGVGDEHESETESDDEDESGSDESLTQGEYVLEPEITGHDRATFHGKLPSLEEEPSAQWLLQEESSPRVKTSLQGSPKAHGIVGLAEDNANQSTAAELSQELFFTQEADSFSRKWEQSFEASALTESATSNGEQWNAFDASSADAFLEGTHDTIQASAREDVFASPLSAGESKMPKVDEGEREPSTSAERPRSLSRDANYSRQTSQPKPSPEDEAYQIMQTLSDLTKMWNEENAGDDTADVASAEYIQSGGDHPLSFTSRVVSFSRENSADPEAVFEDEHVDNLHEEKERQHFIFPEPVTELAETAPEDRASSAEVLSRSGALLTNTDSTIVSVSSSKLESSAPSVERGESFEMSTQKTLRRQPGHGFFVGAGGFQASFPFPADGEDLKDVPVEPESPSWTEKVAAAAKDAYDSLGRKLRRTSKNKKGTGESYGQEEEGSCSEDAANSSETSSDLSTEEEEESASQPMKETAEEMSLIPTDDDLKTRHQHDNAFSAVTQETLSSAAASSESEFKEDQITSAPSSAVAAVEPNDQKLEHLSSLAVDHSPDLTFPTENLKDESGNNEQSELQSAEDSEDDLQPLLLAQTFEKTEGRPLVEDKWGVSEAGSSVLQAADLRTWSLEKQQDLSNVQEAFCTNLEVSRTDVCAEESTQDHETSVGEDNRDENKYAALTRVPPNSLEDSEAHETRSGEFDQENNGCEEDVFTASTDALKDSSSYRRPSSVSSKSSSSSDSRPQSRSSDVLRDQARTVNSYERLQSEPEELPVDVINSDMVFTNSSMVVEEGYDDFIPSRNDRTRIRLYQRSIGREGIDSHSNSEADDDEEEDGGDDGNRVYRRLTPTKPKPSKGLPLVTDPFVDYEADDDESCSERATPITEVKKLPGHQVSLDSDLSAGQEDLDVTEQATEEPVERSHYTGVHQEQSSATNKEIETVVTECHAEGESTADLLEQPAGSFSDVQEMPLSDYETQLRSTAQNIVTAAVESAEKQAMESPLPEPDSVSEHREENHGLQEYPSLSPAQSEMQDRAVTFEEGTAMVQSPSAEAHSPFVDDLVCLQQKPDAGYAELPTEDKPKDAVYVAQPPAGNEETLSSTKTSSANTQSSSIDLLSSLDELPVNVQQNDIDDLSIFTEAETKQWGRNEWSQSSTDAAANAESVDSIPDEDQPERLAFPASSDSLHGLNKDSKKGVTASEKLMKLHAQPVFADTESSEMPAEETEIFPTRVERAAAARATLDQLSREFSESTDSAEASFSKSVDSLSLVNFESQAAAEIELAAQHGFMTSVDELDLRSLSALGVGPSSQTSTEDVASPRLLSRDGALSISSFDVVPSPQASVDVMSPTVSSHDGALSISSFDVVPSPQTSVDVMSPTVSSRDGALSISSFDVVPSPQTSTEIMSPSSLSRDDVFSASSLDAVPPPQASSEDFMSPSQPSRDGVLSTSLDASPSPQGSTDAAAWSAQLSDDDRNSAASEGQAEAAEQLPDARGVDGEEADRSGSPSWVDKAITTARNAYGSLESRFKRKSRKKENGEAGDGDQPEEGPSNDEEELGDDEDVEESGVDAEVRKEEVSSSDVDELAAHQSDHEGSEQGVLEKQHGLLHIYDGEDAAASVEGAVNEDHAFAQAMPRNQLQRSDAFVAEFDIPASSTSPQILLREGTETGVQPNVVTVSPDYIELYDHGSEYNGTALESASEVRDLPSSTDAPETAAVLRPDEDDAECIRETEDLRTSEREKSSSLFAQTNTELRERFLSAEEQSTVAKPDVLSTAVDETEALASGELLVPEDGEAMAGGRPDELVSDIADGSQVREQGEAADHCPGGDDTLVPWDSAATESETPVPDSVTALPVSDSECKDTELASEADEQSPAMMDSECKDIELVSEAGEQSSGMLGSAVQQDGFPDSLVEHGGQSPDDAVVLGEAAEGNLDVDPHSSGDLMQPENVEQPYEDETLPAETVEATAETQVTAEAQSFKDQPEIFGFDLSSEDSAKASVADDTSQEFTADTERPAEVQPLHTDHNLQTLSSMEAAEPLSQTQPSHPRSEYESSEFFERSLPSRTGATSELSQSVGSAGSALQPEEQNITMEHSAFQSDASIATGETAEGLEEDVHQEGESASSEGSQGFMTSSTAAVSQLPESGELHTTVEGLVDSREQTAMLEASSYKSDAISTNLSDDESVADARGQPEEEIRSDSSETKQRFVEASDVASSQLPEFSESEWSTVGAAQLEQQVLSMNQADLRSSAQTATMPSDDESSKRPQIHPDNDEFGHETSETSQISTTSLDQMTWQAPDTTERREQNDGIEEELVAADHIPSESTLPCEHTDDGGRSSPSWMERAMIAAKDAYGSLEKRLRRKKKTKVVLDGETGTEKLEEEGEEEDSWEEDSTDAEDDRKEEPEEKEEDTGNTERFPQETSFAQQTPSDDTSLTETNVTAVVQATEPSAVMEHSPDWANSTDFAERTLEGPDHTIEAVERTLEGSVYSTDAAERTLKGPDHATDDVERTLGGSDNSTDAVEITLEGPDHTIDAAERTLEGPDHTIEADERTLGGSDNSTDAVERTLEGPDHTIDDVERTMEGSDHTIDAVERTLEGSVYSTDAAETTLKGPDHATDAVERTLEGPDSDTQEVRSTESFATMSLAGDVLVEQLSTPARKDLAEETERDIGGETAESAHVQYYGAEDTQRTLADSVDTVEAAHFNNDSSAWVQEDSKQLMSQSLQSQKLSNEEERSTSMDNEYHEVSNTARVDDRNLQDVAEPFAKTSSMVVMALSERPEIGDEDGHGSSKEQEEDHRLNKEEDTTSPTSYRDAYFTALAEREDITVTSEDLQTSQSLPMSHQPPSSSENEQRTLAATEVSKSEAMYRDTYFSALAEKGPTSYTTDILHTEPAVSENRQQDSEPISLKDEGDGQPEENSSEPDYNIAVMDAVRKADKRLVTRLSTEFSLQTNIFDTEDQDVVDADRHQDVFDQGTDGTAGDLSPGEDTVTQHRSAEDDQRFLAGSSEELTLPIAQEDTCTSEALSSVSLVPPGTSTLREEQQTETFVQSSEEELVGDQERNKAEQATAKDTEPDYAVTVIDAVLGADKSLREEQPSLAGAAVADEQVEPNDAICGDEQTELNDASFGDEQVEPADVICGDEQMEPTDASIGDYEESRETSSDDMHSAEQRTAEVQSHGDETGTLTTADVDTASQPQAELVDDNRFRDDEESLIYSYVNEHKQNLLIGSTEATEVLPSTLSTETEYYADKTIADGEIFENEETEENQRLTDKDEADTLRTKEPETSYGNLEDISSQAVAPVREHDEDADDTARDEQTPLEPAQELEHTEDGGRSSPSWMQKAMTAAKEAYGSLEKRLRRKKKKKAADDGSTGTEDVEEDSGEDEYTDTEDDSEEGANDDAVTTENVTVLNAAHPVAGHFKLQDDDDFMGEELQTGQSPPQSPQFSSEREQRELTDTEHTATRAEYSGVTHADLPETGMMAAKDVRMEMSFTGQGSSTEDAAHKTQDFGETQKHLPTTTESFDRELSRNEDEAVDEMTITATITGRTETSPSSGPYVTFPDENDYLQSRQDYKTQVYTSEDDERYLNVNDGITADSNESHDNQPEQQSIEMMMSDDSLLTRQESATIQRHASEDGRADLDDIDAAAANTHHDVVAQSDWQGREMVSTGSSLQSESIHAHQYSSENEQKVLEGGGSETVVQEDHYDTEFAGLQAVQVAEAEKLFQKEVESSVSNQNSNEDTQNDLETNPETAFHKDVSDIQFEGMQEAETHAEKHEKTESVFRGNSENEQNTVTENSEPPIHEEPTDGKFPSLLERDLSSGDIYQHDQISSEPQPLSSEDEQKTLEGDTEAILHNAGLADEMETVAAASSSTQRYISEDEQPFLPRDADSSIDASHQFSADSRQEGDGHSGGASLHLDFATPQFSSEDEQRSLQEDQKSTVEAAPQYSSESQQREELSESAVQLLQQQSSAAQHFSSEDGQRSLQGAADSTLDANTVQQRSSESWQGDGFSVGDSLCLQEPNATTSQNVSSEDARRSLQEDAQATRTEVSNHEDSSQQGDGFDEGVAFRLQQTRFASQRESSEDGRRFIPGDMESTIEASRQLSSEDWQGDESGESATLRLQETSFASQYGSSEDGRRSMPGDTESMIEASHRHSSETWQGNESGEGVTLRLQETSFASQHGSSEDGRRFMPGDTESAIEASHRLSSEAWQGDESDESATLRLQETNFASQRESSEDGRLSLPGDTESTIEASHRLSSEAGSDESATLRLQQTNQRESSEDGRLSLPGDTESTIEASHQLSSETWQGDESGESATLRLQKTSFAPQRESSEDGRLSLPGDTESTIEASRQPSSKDWQGDESGESVRLRLQETSFASQRESSEDGRLSLPGDAESTIEASRQPSSEDWQGDESDDSATLRLQETSFASQREGSEDGRLSLPGDTESTIEASRRLAFESWPGDRLNESATLRLQETSFTAPHGINEDERYSLPSEAQSTIEAGRQYTSDSRQIDEFSQSETLLLQEKSIASHQGSSEDNRHSLSNEAQSTVEAVRQYSPESWPGDGLKESAALRLPETSFTPQHESSEDGQRSWQGEEESTTDAPRAPSSDFWQRRETGEDATLLVGPQQGLTSEQEASSSEFHQAFLPGARDPTLSTASVEAARESTGGLSLASTYALTFPSPDDSPRSFSSEESRRTLRSDQEVVLQVRLADASYKGAGQATSYLAGCAALPKAPRQYSADGVSGQWFYKRSSLCAL